MAINIPIVTEFDSKGLQSAQGAFNNFKTKVNEADTTMGKFKAGAGAALSTVKANATEFAAVAGTAIAKFAIDATLDFKNLALEVGKFSDATGLSLDEASRMLEVSGDLDIAATIVEKAIIRMNTQAGTGKEKFEKLGIELEKHKDGTYDPTGTFLNVIERLKEIRDPAEKARVGTELLGKGWKELTEIITLGGPGLAAALNAVSDAKIVSKEDLQAARDLRDAIDTLKDRFGDLANNLGSFLLPKLADLVTAADKIIGQFNGPLGKAFDYIADGARIVADSLNPLDSIMGGVKRTSDDTASVWERGYGVLQTFGGVLPGVNTALDSLGGWLFGSKEKSDDLTESTDKLKTEWELATIGAGRLRYEGLKGLSDATKILDDNTNNLVDTFDKLLGRLDQEEAFKRLDENLKEYETAVLQAFKKKTPEAIEEAKTKANELIREIAGVAQQTKISSQEQLKIVALLEKGQFDLAIEEVRRAIDIIPKNIPITFTGTFQGISVPSGGQTPSETIGGPTYRPPTTPRIGSLRPMSLSATPPASNNVTVNVAGSVTTEADLVESIRKGLVNAQRNGAGLVYSNQ